MSLWTDIKFTKVNSNVLACCESGVIAVVNNGLTFYQNKSNKNIAHLISKSNQIKSFCQTYIKETFTCKLTKWKFRECTPHFIIEK